MTFDYLTNPGTWFFGAHGRVEAPEALLANVEVYPNLLGEDGVRRAGLRALADLHGEERDGIIRAENPKVNNTRIDRRPLHLAGAEPHRGGRHPTIPK